MNDIGIILRGNELNEKYFTPEILRSFIDKILNKMNISNWCMSLTLTDNEEIHQFNKKWRNMDKPTDVLTFSQYDGIPIPQWEKEEPIEIGDIVISLEQVWHQAEELDIPVEEELSRVIIHGILHLKGMDHPNDDYKGEMLRIQEQLVMETRLSAK